MDFEWDDNKNLANQEKHGLSFETAAEIFSDENALIDINRNDGEERFQIIGLTADRVVVLFVVFTERGCNGEKNIRIISARKAGKKERGRYYAEREEPEQARGSSAPE